jgi:DNA polymerase-1
MIVGEAPGAREDETHRAFVGAAGQLLTELLTGVGISREDCFITNAAKCRPDNNRTPTRQEAKVCSSTYLLQEIEAVQPTHLLALGNTALQVTTGRSGITKYRGKTFPLGDALVLPTFHPAAALRSPKYLPAIKADFAAFARLCVGDVGVVDRGTRTKLVRNIGQLKWLLRRLAEAQEVAFDLETDGLEEWREGVEIVTIGFSWQEGTAVVVPLHHPESPFAKPHRVLEYLKPILEAHPRLIAHNGKFDARWLAASGIFVNVSFDTMLAAHVLDENRSKALESLCEIDLGLDGWKLGGDIRDPRQIPLKKLGPYNGKDCDNTLRLKHLYTEQLKAKPRLARLFLKLMMPANAALTQVERGGMRLDPDRLAERTAHVEALVAKLVRHMDKSSGGINYNSPAQVGHWLFNGLKLPIIEETKTGNASTKESVLFALRGQHKQIDNLLEYRKYHKFLTTYLHAWSKLHDEKYRIHTSYLLHGTTTGRISSRNPNLQQVPRDPLIRSIFGSPPGWLFMEADYSQVELRLMAMIANETNMLRILATGEDMHFATASSILKKLPSEITKDERVVWGKHPNFGLIFGMGPGEEGKQGGYLSYCRDNGIEMDEGSAMLTYNRFHEAYPRLRMYHDRQKRLAARYQRVQNLFGRVRHLPDIASSDKSVRAEAERQAINSPIQSLASDMCLFSLVRLHKKLDPRECRIIASTHDAIAFEVREQVAEDYAFRVKDEMEDMKVLRKTFGAEITVPIEVDVTIGSHWGES